MDQISSIGSYSDNTYNPHVSTAISNTSSTSNVGSTTDYSHERQPVFKEDHTYSGEVTDLINNRISVRLSDDTIIKANISDSSNINIGDILHFKVYSDNNELFLTPLKANEDPQSQMIDKALAAAGLPKNIKTISIASELLNNNMSIDKQSIQKILIQSFQNKGVSINTLVVMNKHNIPVTGDNAIQLENYRNNEHRIVQEISTLAKDIILSLKHEISDSAVIKLNNEYLNLINNSPSVSSSVMTKEPLLIESYISPNDGNNISNILKMFNTDEELLNRIDNHTATLRETAIAINKAMETATVLDLSGAYTDNNSSIPTYLANACDVFINPAIENVLKKFASLQNNKNELSSYMNDFGRGTINAMIKGLPGSQALSDDIWKGDISSKDVLIRLNNIIRFLPDEQAADILRSNEYTTVLSKALTGNWTLTPDDLKQEGIIDEKYKNLYESIKHLSEITSASLNNTENAANINQTSQSLRSNIEFMNTLNELFPYIQLPLRLKGQNVHSDLYVMTNKKKLAKDNSNISVLLHLDMQSLKPVDININLSGNTVNARFYMSDATSKALVENNMEHLKFALLEKGFLFSSQVLEQKEDIDIVKDFIDKDNQTSSLKRYSFDIRA